MKKQAGSLDTNVLLRLLLNDIPAQHQAALRLLETGNSFRVADTAFIEIVFILERNYQFNRLQITEAVEGLSGLTALLCNRVLLENALAIFETHPSLSFEDCCLVSYARLDQSEPLWTFDKKLAAQAINARLLLA